MVKEITNANMGSEKGTIILLDGDMYVTKRHNSGNRCNSANNSRKPLKAHCKTESWHASADHQHNERRCRKTVATDLQRERPDGTT